MSEVMLQFLANDLNMMVTMVACLLLMMRYEPRKGHFALRLTLSQCAVALFCLLINTLRMHLGHSLNLLGSIAKYTGVLALMSWGVLLCFKVYIGAAMLNVASAFCVRHIAYRLKSLFSPPIASMATEKPFTVGDALVNLGLSLLLIALYYVVFERKRGRRNGCFRRIDTLQVLVCAAVLCMDIVFGLTFVDYAVRIGAERMLPFGYVSSIFFSLLTLVISQCHMELSRDAQAIDAVNRLLEEERTRYRREQMAIEALNIKAHDLKHILTHLRGGLDEKGLAEIDRAIRDYDSMCHTGNAALDVVVAQKSLICLGRGIVFSHICDGRCLAHMDDSEIYTLFGNLLDNAIDAVENIADTRQRIISLSISNKKGLIVIHAENYYEGALTFVDGLPQTTHENRQEHGYGLKSIRFLTRKYGGHMQVHADGHIFSVDILLPGGHNA